ncbi:hypothetical protein SXCC_02721 [Gluconacetobacter sp. SXCC-1]|nr:hypothetical protein SXCC_02721 [Gluconacetobacter sp. SXCC-1]
MIRYRFEKINLPFSTLPFFVTRDSRFHAGRASFVIADP